MNIYTIIYLRIFSLSHFLTVTRCRPLFQHGRGLSVEKVLDVCVKHNFDKMKVCRQVPSPYPDGVFVAEGITQQDIACDDSGRYGDHTTLKKFWKMNLDGSVSLWKKGEANSGRSSDCIQVGKEAQRGYS